MTQRFNITEVTINNFRMFQSLHAADFGQVNLITGRNNSGKTTFLEALFLSLGPANPQLWMNINARRGLERVGKSATTFPYLFNSLNTEAPITIDVVTKNYSSYRLEISNKGAAKDKRIIREERDSSQEAFYSNSTELKNVLELSFQPKKGTPIVTTATVDKDGIVFDGENLNIFPTSVYVSAEAMGSMALDANRYDELNKKGLISEFEKSLVFLLPGLKRTSLGIENDVPMIFADVGYGLVPLALLGSGSRRLASILLAIRNAKNAVALLDEIEYGFHHSVLSGVWNAITNFCEANNVQVFATTHSNECIKVASEIFSKKENSRFQLHRISHSDGKSELKTFSPSQLEVALENELDVR